MHVDVPGVSLEVFKRRPVGRRRVTKERISDEQGRYARLDEAVTWACGSTNCRKCGSSKGIECQLFPSGGGFKNSL
eukprot:743445-Pyramimonas_sp.AAC.1